MTFRRYRLLTGTSAAACLLAATSQAQCQAQDLRSFRIPAGPLAQALTAYGVQADRQLLFTSDLVAGLSSPGLSGRYTPEAGLDRLLAGTGLAWSESRPGVLVLRRAATASAEPATAVEGVVVTGTLLKGPGDTPSPVTVITRTDLDRTGRGTVADALVSLPQNYAGSATQTSILAGTDPMQSNSGFATGVNLRGLGADSTLVLVNGRRLAGTGGRGDFADVTAIPTAAVQRVDVLLDGASALYGADAVGGVVNIILRRTFEGHESRLRVGGARGGAESLIAAHTFGASWRGGSGLISYEYERQGALGSGDRDYARDGDLRPFGGTDHRTYHAVPGTIVTLDPVLGFRAAYAVRPRAGGVATSPADFVPGTNLGHGREGQDLLPQQDRHSAYAHARQALGGALELSGDVRWSRRAFGLDFTAPALILTVGRANPHFVSPTGAASHQIAYSFEGELDASRREGASESLGASLGAALSLPRGWDAEVYGAYGREEARSRHTGLPHSGRLAEALGNAPDNPATPYSPTRDGYLNLFGSGDANDAAVLGFVSSGWFDFLDRSTVASANALVQGPLRTLPGGPVRLALGAQVRTETLFNGGASFTASETLQAATTPERQRRVSAVFAETRIPLAGAGNARPGLRSLELSVAARAESYDDVGSTANPKVGLLWRPIEPLVLRASWGTSFRAPALTEIHDRYLITGTFVSEGPVRRVALVEVGGNPDLRPETAESFTAGFAFRPARSGLRLEAGWFDTRFKDQIGRPALEGVARALTDPSLAPFVRRVDPRNNPADRARVEALVNHPAYPFRDLFPVDAYGVIIDGRWVNTASVQVRGLDAAASWDGEIGRERVRLEAAGSYVTDYERAVTPAAAPVELVDRLGFPVDFRGTAAATWLHDDWSLRAAVNHVSGYRDAAGLRIDPWTTSDLLAAWSPHGGWMRGLQAQLGVRNLLNTAPPFYDAPTGLGFDPGQADPLGRVAFLQLTRRW